MSSIIDTIRDKLPSALLEIGLQGCSAEELISISRSQQVSCLPSVYQDLMLLMGRRGIDWILDADATIQSLTADLKQAVFAEFRWMSMAYPQDIFIFEDHEASTVAFFRTRDCEDDPAVFSNWEAGCFRKMADSLSGYVLRMTEQLQESEQERMKSSQEWSREILHLVYRYDPEQDEFVLIPEI